MNLSKKILSLFIVSTIIIANTYTISAYDAETNEEKTNAEIILDNSSEQCTEDSSENNYDKILILDDKKTDYETSNASSVKVSSMSIKSVNYLKVGEKTTISNTISPTNATHKDLSWISSNENIATVDSNGVVTALKKGRCTIEAVTTDGSNISSVGTLVISQPVTSISLSSKNITLQNGSSKKITSTIMPKDASSKTLSWKSSNINIAEVSATGTVKAKSPGNCTITATTTDGSKISAKCSVTVTQPISSLDFSNTFSTLYIGDSKTLSTVISPSYATNKTLKWVSSNPNVATVSSRGTVKGISEGSCTITATTKDGTNISKSLKINVKKHSVLVNKITMSNKTINEGQTISVSPTISPTNANNKGLTYTSSNNSIATVSSNGIITAVSKGTCTIYATAKDGSNTRGKCIVVVNRPVTNVTLNAHSINWNVGKSAHFYPTVTPSDASNVKVTYSSDNTAVATVDNNGLLTAVSAGTCTITCRARDGSDAYDTCRVTVKQPVKKISLNGNSNVNIGESIQLTATISPTNATNKNLVWSSSDTNIAVVNSLGKVTGISSGTATIKCSSKDNSNVYAVKTINVVNSSKGQQIADYAASWVGVTPYVWGGTSLYTGADCSGFVCCVYEHFGYNLWYSRVDLDMVGYEVPLSSAKPGDIIVYSGHVAIYAGNGMVTHALNENWGVVTTDISWGGNVRCVRRVVD